MEIEGSSPLGTSFYWN